MNFVSGNVDASGFNGNVVVDESHDLRSNQVDVASPKHTSDDDLDIADTEPVAKRVRKLNEIESNKDRRLKIVQSETNCEGAKEDMLLPKPSDPLHLNSSSSPTTIKQTENNTTTSKFGLNFAKLTKYGIIRNISNLIKHIFFFLDQEKPSSSILEDQPFADFGEKDAMLRSHNISPERPDLTLLIPGLGKSLQIFFSI